MTADDAVRKELRAALKPIFARLISYEIGADQDRDERSEVYLQGRQAGLGATEVGRIASEVAVAAVERAVANARLADGVELDADALLKACGATEATVRVTDRIARAGRPGRRTRARRD